MKPSKNFRTLKAVLETSGLGLFLAVGLTGCSDKDCYNVNNSASKINECLNGSRTGSPGGSGIYSSGFFSSSSNSAYAAHSTGG